MQEHYKTICSINRHKSNVQFECQCGYQSCGHLQPIPKWHSKYRICVCKSPSLRQYVQNLVCSFINQNFTLSGREQVNLTLRTCTLVDTQSPNCNWLTYQYGNNGRYRFYDCDTCDENLCNSSTMFKTSGFIALLLLAVIIKLQIIVCKNLKYIFVLIKSAFILYCWLHK